MLRNIELAKVDITKLKSEILKACIIRLLSRTKEIESANAHSGYGDSPSYNNYDNYSDYGDKYDYSNYTDK